MDGTVQGGGLGLSEIGLPSARFTCKRPGNHGHRNTNYSNKLQMRVSCIITDVEIDDLLAEEYFTNAHTEKYVVLECTQP